MQSLVPGTACCEKSEAVERDSLPHFHTQYRANTASGTTMGLVRNSNLGKDLESSILIRAVLYEEVCVNPVMMLISHA